MKYWLHVILVSIKNPLSFMISTISINGLLIFIFIFYTGEPLWNFFEQGFSGSWDFTGTFIKILDNLKGLVVPYLILFLIDLYVFLYKYPRRKKLVKLFNSIVEQSTNHHPGIRVRGSILENDPWFIEAMTCMTESKLCSTETIKAFDIGKYVVQQGGFIFPLPYNEARYMILRDELNRINKDLRR